MTIWVAKIDSLKNRLDDKPAIPRPVIEFLDALAKVEPRSIAHELDPGALDRLIRRLDPTSLELSAELATELRSAFEETRAFEAAAAIDLVADRLRDEAVRS